MSTGKMGECMHACIDVCREQQVHCIIGGQSMSGPSVGQVALWTNQSWSCTKEHPALLPSRGCGLRGLAVGRAAPMQRMSTTLSQSGFEDLVTGPDPDHVRVARVWTIQSPQNTDLNRDSGDP